MKVGDRVEIISMDGEPQYAGKTGVITSIEKDPWGDTQIHGTWGGCALYVGIDRYIVKEDHLV